MTFKERLRTRMRAESLGLLAKYNDKKRLWEVWEVKKTVASILKPTRKIYEGKRIKSFLKKKKLMVQKTNLKIGGIKNE